MLTAELEIHNPSGLHARPAATLVKAAAAFRSQIRIENLSSGAAPVNAKSLLAVLGSGVEKGHRVRISADGEDEAAAVESLTALSESGFGETTKQ